MINMLFLRMPLGCVEDGNDVLYKDCDIDVRQNQGEE